MIRLALSCLALFLLAACGSGDPGYVRPGDYEGDVGEAMVRHLIKTLPDVAPGVPKEYCVMASRVNMHATSMDFVARMKDLNVTFVSGDALETQRETSLPVNPKSGLTPYVIQLAYIYKKADDTWEVEAGWSYKRLFERHNYHLKRTGSTWSVEDKGKTEGNYVPGAKP